jgi:hypothetical protein
LGILSREDIRRLGILSREDAEPKKEEAGRDAGAPRGPASAETALSY